MNTILIQFLRPWSVYTAGDCVAFDETRARSLIDSGIAQRRLSAPPEEPKDKLPAKDPKEPKKPADSKSKSPTSETTP